MSEELLETEDSLNLDENQDSKLENEETAEQLKEKLTKAEELAANQKIRAEKAEKALKAKPATKETPKSEGLTAKDIVSLRDVHEDDVDYLLEEAKLRGKTVQELKKDPYVKIILKTKAEERASALAASTESKRGTKQEGGETILENFNKGIVSEKDEDIEKLVAQQIAAKKASAGLNK